MTAFQNDIEAVQALKEHNGSSWHAINPEYVARMRAQNRFQDGARDRSSTLQTSCAAIWKSTTQTPRSTPSHLGVWHGFIGQQKMISIKKHLKTTNKRYLYLSGWMVAALRSEIRPAARPIDA